MDKASTILLILIAMVICVAIGVFGVLKYQETHPVATEPGDQQPTQLSEQDQQELGRLRLLKSSLVNSIVLFGQVESISGNTIKLGSGQDSLPMVVDPSANVYFVNASGANAGESTPAQFSDIKVGDGVQAEANLSPDGQLSSFYIAIIKQ